MSGWSSATRILPIDVSSGAGSERRRGACSPAIMYRFLQRVATLAWRPDGRPSAGVGEDRMKRQGWLLVLSAGTLLWTSGYLYAQRATERKGWTPGKGYGWVWGRNDEVGALNTL